MLAAVIMGFYSFSQLFSGGEYSPLRSSILSSNPIDILSLPYTFFTFSLGMSFGPSLDELHRLTAIEVCKPYLAQIIPAIVVFTALFLLGLKSLWRDREKFNFVVFYLMVPIVSAALLSLKWSTVSYNVRYLSFALSTFIIIIAHGLLAPRSKVIQGVLFVSFMILTLMSLHNHYYAEKYFKEDYRSAAEFVSEHSQDGDIVVSTNTRPFLYYYQGSLEVHPFYWSPTEYRERIETPIQGYSRMWLVISRPWENDPRGKMKEYIKDTYPKVVENSLPNLYLGLFDLSSSGQD
jgi:hypothetical protein